jgi:prepilin-type N-terminal cleavage/methylation domain-containing protein
MLKLYHRGFTIFEVLMVITIICVLAGAVIIMINPSKQLGDSRNSQRRVDATTILNAIQQYALDNDGKLPKSVTGTAAEICATGSANCNGLIGLSALTAKEKYLASIPKDPQCTTTCAPNGTGYRIFKTVKGRITVQAPAAEQGEIISVTR